MKIFLVVLIAIAGAMFPAQSHAAEPEPVVKTFCTYAIGYQSLDELKADLLTSAKREAVNEIFGEILTASTDVENYVVTNDQIRTSSIGYVRLEGNASFYNGDNLAEVCVTIRAYATEDDFVKFEPLELVKRNCVTDAKLTTSALTAYAKEEAIYQALLDYDRKLDGKDRNIVLQLMQRIEYIESGFIPDTETYCVQVSGYVVPVEVIAFLESESGTSDSAQAATAKSSTAGAPLDSTGSDGTPPSSEECSSSIVYGQTMICTIDYAGQEAIHTFEGKANDRVSIIAVKQEGKLYPQFQLLDGDGERVSGCRAVGDPVAKVECNLLSSGNYTIVFGDYGAVKLGSYRLSLQRLNGPAAAGDSRFGATVEGDIEAMGEEDYYAFTAEANDRVSIIAVKQEGKLYPQFQLLDGDGDPISGCRAVGDPVARVECNLPSSGNYTIVFGDYGAVKLGHYRLSLQRLNGPAEAVDINLGATVEGAIEAVGEEDYYAFTAEANDRVSIIAVKQEGKLYPQFQLLDGDGDRVNGCRAVGDPVAQVECDLLSSGSYTIVFGDYGGTNVGIYTVQVTSS